MAKDAIECARLRFSNISLDLMCGLPGQTKESFTYSLKTAIELGISHISVYPLTFEKRTPFYTMMQQGVFSESEEELSDIAAEMMILAQDLLEKAGFHRYEVASYAKPGFECTHNKAYWTGKPYLGFGSGAVSMLQNNQQRLRIRAGVVEEKLNVGEFLVEDLMLGMRMSEGVSEEAVENVQSFNSATHSVFENLIQQGLVKRENGRFKPTNKGWLWGNIIYSHILDLA
jgi:oxygen-independent coproporphyrinogen-3 oxidase